MPPLKTFCYVSAVINLIFTFLSGLGCMFIWSWYDQPGKENERLHFRETALWVWIMLSFCNIFGFFSSILLLRGIAKDKFRYFQPYFYIMLFIISFLLLQAIYTAITPIKPLDSPTYIASEFFSEAAVCGFIGIVMIPCFRYYTQLAGQSFFTICHKCCPCCVDDENKRSRVPNYQV